MIPVHPGDGHLLGVQWAGQLYFDTRLPFGLRSAPKIITAVVDALQWSMVQQGVLWVAHYLDDYITLGPPGSLVCQNNVDQMLTTCRRLGVPVAPVKCEGPASVLTFLGFELDTKFGYLRSNCSRFLRWFISGWGRKDAGSENWSHSWVTYNTLQCRADICSPPNRTGGSFPSG